MADELFGYAPTRAKLDLMIGRIGSTDGYGSSQLVHDGPLSDLRFELEQLERDQDSSLVPPSATMAATAAVPGEVDDGAGEASAGEGEEPAAPFPVTVADGAVVGPLIEVSQWEEGRRVVS